ncbi:MAG: hypothetical protein R3B96_22755 [Pirellulaceae bacterium]
MPARKETSSWLQNDLRNLGWEFMQAVFAAKPGIDKVVATIFRNQRVFAINVIERT